MSWASGNAGDCSRYGSGDGGVLMKETSTAETVWLLYKQCQQKLQSVIQSLVYPHDSPQRASQNIKCENYDAMRGKKTGSEKTSSKRTIHRSMACINKSPPAQPIGTLTEIRRYTSDEQINGERNDGQSGMQQLLPALASFCGDRWLVLVSPPQRPEVAELIVAGIDPSRVLVVYAQDSNGLSVVEQALRLGTCGAVLAWLEACDVLALEQLRQAAVAGHAWGVMFREERVRENGSNENTAQPVSQPVQEPKWQHSVKPVCLKARQAVAPVVDIRSATTQTTGYPPRRVKLTKVTKEKMAQIEMAIS